MVWLSIWICTSAPTDEEPHLSIRRRVTFGHSCMAFGSPMMQILASGCWLLAHNPADSSWSVQDGTAKIGDVGMARMTSEGYLTTRDAATGTFAWAAPEMLLNDPCTEKVDVYSLGVVLWEVRTREWWSEACTALHCDALVQPAWGGAAPGCLVARRSAAGAL